MKKGFLSAFLILAAIMLTAVVSSAQERSSRGSLECRDSWDNGRLVNHCEITERTAPVSGTVTVDAGQNGGISIRGADRNDLLIRTRIQTAAPSENEANDLAKQIRIETAGTIKAVGPEQRHDYNWSVSFEIYVPRHSDLSLVAHNGGISISEVQGKMDFECMNGGVSLKRVGGNVHGETTNGGVSVELAGDRWEGETLDVHTTNGGVILSVPENYSAHLETGTVNGSVSVDFPLTVQGRITKEISTNIGAGGATIRAMTTNGGVRVKRSLQ
jgi:hypothetical protein